MRRRLPFSLAAAALVVANTVANDHDAASIRFFDTIFQQQQQHRILPSPAESVDPDAARLILTSRLGLSQQGEVGEVEEEVVRQLDDYGGYHPELFGGNSGDEDIRKFLLIWEGLGSAVPSVEGPGLDIVVPYAPVDFVDDTFVKDILVQRSSTRSGTTSSRVCNFDFEVDSELRGSLLLDILNKYSCPSEEQIFPGSQPRNLNKEDFIIFISWGLQSWSEGCQSAVLRMMAEKPLGPESSMLSKLFAELSLLASDSMQESTVVILPPSASSRNAAKRAANLQRPEELEEQLLSQTISSPSTSPAPDSHHLTTRPHTGRIQSPLSSAAFPPICHATNDSCTEATANCSGHGYCYRKYSPQAGGDSSGRKDCYACKCVRTIVRQDADGSPIKTIHWGGAACQKKDVSVPFFLIFSLTILLVMAISAAVGLLYKVGSEDLPGVLSAGVAVRPPK